MLTLHPPPRPVPSSLLVRVVCGNLLHQVGWALVALGLALSWGLRVDLSIAELGLLSGSVVEHNGSVRSVEATAMTSNQGSVETRPVQRIGFEFSDASGAVRQGISYSNDALASGQPVTIEQSRSWPVLARIKGARYSPAGPLGLIALLPALGGLIVVAFGLWLGRRKVALLRKGLLATAKFVDRKETAASVNDEVVWALDYVFRGDDMHEHHAIVRTHRPQQYGETDQQVLFAPSRASRALLVATLAGKLRLDSTGNFAPVGYLLTLLLPVAMVAVLVASIAALFA